MKWNKIAGFGVAGNFTGHLEQAGESSDFLNVEVQDDMAPKGIFPFYIPNSNGDHPLHQMPISSTRIRLSNTTENHQIEPELSLLLDVSYRNNKVYSVLPRFAMAHNDCSIRRKGARKISEKKNWGAESKGVSAQRIPIDRFAAGGILDNYQLACYLLRDGVFHTYGVTSPVTTYSYFYGRLLDWLQEKLSNQKETGPLEDIWQWLELAGKPEQILVSVGATRYTEYGERTFLQPGDVSIVALFDQRYHSEEAIKQSIAQGKASDLSNVSLLVQEVVFP